MVIKYHDRFFIQWDNIFNIEDRLHLGIFNFWIDDVCYPGKGINITLNSLFYDLTTSISYIEQLQTDIGEIPIHEIDFTNFDNEHLVWIDTGELFQFGFTFIIGYHQNTERIFMTNDFEKSYSEIVLPKGTILATLKALQEYAET